MTCVWVQRIAQVDGLSAGGFSPNYIVALLKKDPTKYSKVQIM